MTNKNKYVCWTIIVLVGCGLLVIVGEVSWLAYQMFFASDEVWGYE